MTKRLALDALKCSECRACELQCSLVHFGVFNAHKSVIRIVPDWPAPPGVHLCLQCADPDCLPACPGEALVWTGSGAIAVVADRCNSCGLCEDACVYNGIWRDPLSGIAIKCDTCEGRFECVPMCAPGALSVVD
jgi:Fe-S-cluster-containing hydrogenase component 2